MTAFPPVLPFLRALLRDCKRQTLAKSKIIHSLSRLQGDEMGGNFLRMALSSNDLRDTKSTQLEKVSDAC